jgi:2-isopropylmalate synthase
MGLRKDDPKTLEKLSLFTKAASDILNNPIPENTPMYGKNAFATASGVHAAAIRKEAKGDSRILYFAFEPGIIGQKPVVDVGSFSGKANVLSKLEELGIDPVGKDKMVQDILKEAKQARGLLTETTIRGIVKRYMNGNHQ